jgi:hypothetical protein
MAAQATISLWQLDNGCSPELYTHGLRFAAPFPEPAHRWSSPGPLLAEFPAADSPSLKRFPQVLVLIVAFVYIPWWAVQDLNL